MNANQYPITTQYGYVPGYPLHGGFHQGIDYGCPVGTPVIVNGVVIGLSGNTGYTFGPHLHLGKWIGGVVQNPYTGGFQFTSATVTEVDPVGNSDNGKFVRVQGDGASWVYLHLNSINVTVGQVLQGGDMTDAQIMEEFSKRDKRMDRIEADISQLYRTLDEVNKSNQADIEDIGRLYVTVDDLNKRIAQLEKNPGSGTLEGDYHIKPV